MNTVIRTTLIILLLAAFPAGIKAQEDLHSASVFQKYGKQKGVTMVELSRDMLDSYRIDLYKSLVFKDVTEALPGLFGERPERRNHEKNTRDHRRR